MLKAELHCHVRGDPVDVWISYTARELIDRLCSLDYDVVAITPHMRLFDDPDAFSYAEERGILLISGMEARISNRDVLLYNCGKDAESIRTWDELEAYRAKNPHVLVIAPHPFFPEGPGSLIAKRPDLFDAWEWSMYYSRTFNINRRLKPLARQFGKPIVGTGDLHSLKHAGRTFTLIDAQRSRQSVFDAIRDGKVYVESEPMTTWELIRLFAPMVPSYAVSLFKRFAGLRDRRNR